MKNLFVLLTLVCALQGSIYALPTCIANFEHYALTTNSDSVHFYDNNGNSSHAHFSWSFGDGSSSTAKDPWHYFSAAGTYYVCLTVSDSNSSGTCSDTWCDSVVVTATAVPTCNAHFSHYNSISNVDSVHYYNSNSNSANAVFTWSFGDGTSSHNKDPWHLYSSNGWYHVCLTVRDTTNAGTCTDTWCDSIHITTQSAPVCNAHFIHYAIGCSGDSVHFYDNNTNASNAHFSWSFGDGSSASTRDPWHHYSSNGTYTVCLTVTDTTSSGTCIDTWCDSVVVASTGAPSCNAHFSHYNLSSYPDSLHFTNTNSNSSHSHFTWSFGDGSSSLNKDPWHRYATVGVYYVCLTVSDSNACGTCSQTWCDSVHVSTQSSPTCNAHFSHYALTCHADSVHFYNNNSNSTHSAFTWSFGDGTSATTHDPWHHYSSTGTFYVCLTVRDTNSGGVCSDTWCDSIHISASSGPVCNAHFAHYANSNNLDSVHFYDNNSNPSNAHFTWSFGDGSSATTHDPWHAYTTDGTYYVCLTVTDTTSCGTCSDTWCDSVHVGNGQTPLVMKLDPNPMNDHGTLKLQNTPRPVSLKIYDISGNVVLSLENMQNGDFDVRTSQYRDGLFYYVLSDGNSVVSSGKLIILH